jgi:hypothetical protein
MVMPVTAAATDVAARNGANMVVELVDTGDDATGAGAAATTAEGKDKFKDEAVEREAGQEAEHAQARLGE